MMQYTFDENTWRNICESLAETASRHCGLSHGLYVRAFSNPIHRAIANLSPQDKIAVIAIAREWDFATEDEIKRGEADDSEADFCVHGLDQNCCPAGCGEY